MSSTIVRTYFAYGSNMNQARVATRGLRVRTAAGARLPGYELRFNKAGAHHPGVAHANIERASAATVEGVLYEFDDGAEILKMDPFERAPWNYGRDAVAVQTDQGSVWAWTYFANPAVKREGLLPSQEYMEHLLAGAAFLTQAYLQRLRDWPVVPRT